MISTYYASAVWGQSTLMVQWHHRPGAPPCTSVFKVLFFRSTGAKCDVDHDADSDPAGFHLVRTLVLYVSLSSESQSNQSLKLSTWNIFSVSNTCEALTDCYLAEASTEALTGQVHVCAACAGRWQMWTRMANSKLKSLSWQCILWTRQRLANHCRSHCQQSWSRPHRGMHWHVTHSFVHRGTRDLIDVFQSLDCIHLHSLSALFLVCLFVFAFIYCQAEFSKCWWQGCSQWIYFVSDWRLRSGATTENQTQLSVVALLPIMSSSRLALLFAAAPSVNCSL